MHHLVVPRFLACLLLIPLLTVMADCMGIVGGAVICLKIYGIDPHHYWQHGKDFIGLWDVVASLIKATAFGGIIALIACHRGFNSRPGSEGVGRAATESFVLSFIAILALDFFLELLLNTLQGQWCNLLRVRRAGILSRHLHPAPVHGYVIKGKWYYLEHDWVAETGSYVFEPPGEIHTLTVPADCPEMITFFTGPRMCFLASLASVKCPVDSITT